jgi:hypothetical protein
VRGLVPDERWALEVLIGPDHVGFDVMTQEGARAETAARSLLERGCASVEHCVHDDRVSAVFTITDLGRLALRASRVIEEGGS